jgi:hypothetical protein
VCLHVHVWKDVQSAAQINGQDAKGKGEATRSTLGPLALAPLRYSLVHEAVCIGCHVAVEALQSIPAPYVPHSTRTLVPT